MVMATNRYWILLIAVLFGGAVFAQPGEDEAIVHLDPIDSADVDRHFETLGLMPGDTLPELTFYDVDGNAVRTADLIGTKPLVIMSVSYSCSEVHMQNRMIETTYERFSDQAEFLMVYVEEAHIETGYNPVYANYGNMIEDAGVSIRMEEHDTYGDRVAAAKLFLDSVGTSLRMVVDNPENQWFALSGLAPSPAYIIGLDGVIQDRLGWMTKSDDKYELAHKINEYLSLLRNGRITVDEKMANYRIESEGGGILEPNVVLFTEQDKDIPVVVKTFQTRLPEGWSAEICLDDVCGNALTGQFFGEVLPDKSMTVSVRFHATDEPAEGFIILEMGNQNDPKNKLLYKFSAEVK